MEQGKWAGPTSPYCPSWGKCRNYADSKWICFFCGRALLTIHTKNHTAFSDVGEVMVCKCKPQLCNTQALSYKADFWIRKPSVRKGLSWIFFFPVALNMPTQEYCLEVKWQCLSKSLQKSHSLKTGNACTLKPRPRQCETQHVWSGCSFGAIGDSQWALLGWLLCHRVRGKQWLQILWGCLPVPPMAPGACRIHQSLHQKLVQKQTHFTTEYTTGPHSCIN